MIDYGFEVKRYAVDVVLIVRNKENYVQYNFQYANIAE